MEYVVLRDEETGKVDKIGRFLENGLAEQFCNNNWESDSSLYSLMFDGLLETISKVEAERIMRLQRKTDKIAA
jgi:hypothetical protein